LKAILIAFLSAVLAFPQFSKDSKFGSLCVAPIPIRASSIGTLCDSGKLSLKVDKMEPVAWPHEESLKIGGLDLSENHRVVTTCDGKPIQSVRFNFSAFKTENLCLEYQDLFDGYEGLRLWDAKHAPWCKCK
jgi:hypothetical protein